MRLRTGIQAINTSLGFSTNSFECLYYFFFLLITEEFIMCSDLLIMFAAVMSKLTVNSFVLSYN